MDNLLIRSITEEHIQREDRIEIPCKDMDFDCLPDAKGEVPFGSYAFCYVYDYKKGLCPFLPLQRRR